MMQVRGGLHRDEQQEQAEQERASSRIEEEGDPCGTAVDTCGRKESPRQALAWRVAAERVDVSWRSGEVVASAETSNKQRTRKEQT